MRKASRRDLAAAVAQGATAATTVAATMALAHRAGIRVFATGGIGGVHPSPGFRWGLAWPQVPDVSADLTSWPARRSPWCAPAPRAFSTCPRTLEVLETYAVPVVGYGTDDFPAFYVRSSGLPVAARVDSPSEAAVLLAAHWALDGAGVVLAQPLPEEEALHPGALAMHLEQAERQASEKAIRGPALTPFLLARLAELSNGATLRANRALVVANAHLAAQVAAASAPPSPPPPAGGGREGADMRTLAIGDIHGCLTALKTLLDFVAPASDDRLIALGDYVDRGPDSRGVLDFLIALHASGRLVALRGNHDEMMADAHINPKGDHSLWLACGGLETLQSYGVEAAETSDLNGGAGRVTGLFWTAIAWTGTRPKPTSSSTPTPTPTCRWTTSRATCSCGRNCTSRAGTLPAR